MSDRLRPAPRLALQEQTRSPRINIQLLGDFTSVDCADAMLGFSPRNVLELRRPRRHLLEIYFERSRHSGEIDQSIFQREGLVVCEDLGAWWGRENDGLPLPLGGNVIHKRFDAPTRSAISRVLTASIQYSLDHRAEAVQHALQYARDMGRDLADKFVGMYVNHWTLDFEDKGREAVKLLLQRGYEAGFIPQPVEVEFITA